MNVPRKGVSYPSAEYWDTTPSSGSRQLRFPSRVAGEPISVAVLCYAGREYARTRRRLSESGVPKDEGVPQSLDVFAIGHVLV
jgi:hypothetical protein